MKITTEEALNSYSHLLRQKEHEYAESCGVVSQAEAWRDRLYEDILYYQKKVAAQQEALRDDT